MAKFEASITFRSVLEEVFDFLANPDNLELISHPDVGLEYVVAPDAVELGSQLEFKIEAYGMTQQVTHEVVAYDRPQLITEKQVKGPLGHWLHQRIFESSGGDDVKVIDRIEFEPPGGLIGFVATEERIQKSLKDGFAHQHQELKKHLESAS